MGGGSVDALPATRFGLITCRGWWKIDGEELDLRFGVVSILSLTPLSLAARLTTEGTYSNDELPTASPTGVCMDVLF